MQFVIVGASGYFGRALYEFLKQKGKPVLGTQCSSDQDPFLKFDLTRDRLRSLLSNSHLELSGDTYGIISAAISQIDLCKKKQDHSYMVNVESTKELVQQMRDLSIIPVFLSSAAIFDGRDGYYGEEELPNPICTYGRQKLEVEEFIQKNLEEFLIIRPGKFVGIEPEQDQLFSRWFESVESNEPIKCIEGQIFSPTWVKDISWAVWRLCELGVTGMYHVCTREFFCRAELAHQFIRFLGVNHSIITLPQSEFDFEDPRPQKTYLDPTKFIEETNFYFTPLRRVIDRFIKNARS